MSDGLSKIAFLFPGQGAQTVGMGATVCSQVPAARALFNRAAEVLGYDLYKLCTEGPPEKLDSTVHSQPALFVAGLAALEQLKQNSPELVERCSATAGLSLGEYTALVFAGVGGVLAAGLIGPGAASAQAAESCSDVEVVFARGTAEPAGLGLSFNLPNGELAGPDQIGGAEPDGAAATTPLAGGFGAGLASGSISGLP